MATKQRIVHLVAVLCLSVLTVVLTARVSSAGAPVTVQNTASNPVPTQNVGGGAATHVGQPASQFVDLQCGNGVNCITIAGAAFSVPAGQVFIMTDIQFSATGSPSAQPGTYIPIQVFRENPGVGNEVAHFSAPLDPTLQMSGQAHLTTGIVFPPGSSVSTGGFAVFIQGYLAPNQ